MNILIRPIISEKMTGLGEKLNRYGFIVAKKANKIQIKKAIQDFYGVDVLAVNTMNYSGKETSRNTKSGIIKGRKNSFKKAIVTLAQGDSIDFYSNI
jgi:large subunit ribosomal protein L23